MSDFFEDLVTGGGASKRKTASQARTREDLLTDQKREFESGEAQKQRDYLASQGQAGREFQGAESQLGRDFQGNQNQLNRTMEQSNLDRAYQEKLASIGRGSQDLESGESAFLGAADQTSPELEALQNSITNNALPIQERAMSAAKNNLAQQGVRGGRAATLLNRQSGELNRDLNSDLTNKMYEDYTRRNNMKLGYLGNKARAGQAATY